MAVAAAHRVRGGRTRAPEARPGVLRSSDASSFRTTWVVRRVTMVMGVVCMPPHAAALGTRAAGGGERAAAAATASDVVAQASTQPRGGGGGGTSVSAAQQVADRQSTGQRPEGAGLRGAFVYDSAACASWHW